MAPLFHMEALLPSSISPKIDSILHSHIYPQVGHVFRAVAKFRALLIDVLSKKRTAAPRAGYYYRSRSSATAKDGGKKKKKKKRGKIANFVKLQFTASSSSRGGLDAHYSYYDYSAWSVVVPAEQEEARAGGNDTAECGYLCWLEEERSTGDETPAAGEGGDDGGCDCHGDSAAVNEIDRLAEKFIARFHAKFLLEKQESYRRYQEMMARSV